jgi:hypothetical protein
MRSSLDLPSIPTREHSRPHPKSLSRRHFCRVAIRRIHRLPNTSENETAQTPDPDDVEDQRIRRHYHEATLGFGDSSMLPSIPAVVWTARQLLEVGGPDETPRYLVRDRDAIDGESFHR